MLLSDLSIKRPIFASVMMLALVTLGAFSYKRLAVDMFPDVEIPVITIVTKFPGASPESVEREVSKRIEEAVNPIAGVKKVLSTSRESVSTVIVEFRLEVRINEAAQEARAKVAAIRGLLPQGIEEPIIQKIDFSAMPVVSLAVRSDRLGPRDLTTLVEKKIKRRFENISGVGKVDLVGASKREVNVEIDPRRLEALGMGVDEVMAGLRAENVNTPLGRLNRNGSEFPLRVSGKPDAVELFGTMVVARRDGRPVPLGEVAKITDGIEEQRSLALVNGVPAVALDIQKQSGANTVATVDAVKKEIERLKGELPAGTAIDLVRDASVFIRDSVADVRDTMILGGLLTVFIVFCFLNSWRSTVITGLTLPISVISSFIVMYFLGMTLNVLTLMALSLAIGLLIDDAIVVRENIVRHLEHGQDHFQAAREGTAEIGLAVLATTLSIVAVFVPVAFMKGIIGRFFYQFGITVAFAVLVSLFVSFTLDPMLSSRWHDPDIDRTGKRNVIARILDRFNGWFDRTADRYKGVISWALDHRKTVLLLATAAFAGGVFAFMSLKTEFFSEYDRAEFQVGFKTAPDASLAETRGRLDVILADLRKLPEVEQSYATIGAGDTGTVRDGLVYVKLVGKKGRQRTQFEIQKLLRERLREIPGIIPTISEVGRMAGEKPLNVNVRGENIARLKQYAAELKGAMYAIPGVVDLEVTLEQDIPEFRLTVDRERAANLGVTTDDVVRTVGALVGGQAVSTYEDEDGDAVNVRVRLPLELRQDPSQVERLRIAVRKPSAPPALVPMAEIVDYKMSNTPSEINRQELTRQVVISANLDGLPLGEAMNKVRAAASRIKMEPGYRVAFSGEGEDMVESFGYMAEALVLAVIFVYLILAAQFESFIEPFAIMFSLPLSVVGMAGMLYLTRDTINMMSLIGLIMLMGLVTKNAILLVDYTKVLRSRGMDRREAVVTAGRTRLRPIMMTTLAMIFGMMPLALAIGAGGEMRAPMARAVVGGLITSTVLTLLVVPVVYTLLDDFGAWIVRKWAGAPAKEAKVGALLPLVLAAALLGTGAAPGRAADNAVLVLTLDDALGIAAERSRDIESAREFRRQVEGRYVEERAAALPHVTVTADFVRSRDKSQDFFGLGQTTDAASAQAALSQPLYTWGQIGAAIRAAKMGFGAADERLRAARQAAARDVTAAFYDVLLARELADIAAKAADQKGRHLDEARRKREAGTATDYDVLAAEVALANARPEVIRTENLIRISRERLRFLLAVGAREIDVRGNLEAPIAAAPGYGDAIAAALGNRPELGELRRRIGISQELVAIAAAGDKPRLDFRGGMGWKRVDAGDLSGDGAVWSAGLFASYPIFDGRKASGREAQAKSDVRSLRIEEARLVDSVALEARTAVDAVREAAEVVTALSGTVDQASRLLAMSEKGYEFGVKTKLEVDDAEQALRAARGSLAAARRGYLVARVTLSYAMGTLGDVGLPPERGGKPWTPAPSELGIVREVLTGEPRLPR